jgi:DNA-binding PadR family transcriptional regulator
LIGGFQQAVLISVAALGGDADAAAVRAEVERRLGRACTSGAVHITLQRLEQIRLIASEAVPLQRRRKYRVTAAGLHALEEARREIDQVWNGIASH